MADRAAEETAFTAKVFAALKTWLDAVRTAVRKAWQAVSGRVDPHVIASTQPLWDRLLADLLNELKIMGQKQYANVTQLPGAKSSQLITQSLAETHRLLARMPAEIQEELQQLIGRAVRAGKPPAAIRTIVDDFLDVSKSENWANRAKTIAVTEVHRMANVATQAAGIAVSNMEQTGLNKRWKSHLDDRTRPDHRKADGQVVGLYQPFVVGDSLMQRPGDPTAPAYQNVNCRCEMEIVDRKVA